MSSIPSSRPRRANKSMTSPRPMPSLMCRSFSTKASVGISHVALDGRWLRVNQKLCDIVGYTRAELLQKTFPDITHPDDVQSDLESIPKMLEGEIGTYSNEKRY